MKASSTTMQGLALGGGVVLAVAIACLALRAWLEPSSVAALVDLFSICR